MVSGIQIHVHPWATPLPTKRNLDQCEYRALWGEREGLIGELKPEAGEEKNHDCDTHIVTRTGGLRGVKEGRAIARRAVGSRCIPKLAANSHIMRR